MLLSVLGACAVVGPFQGAEWEPLRGLVSETRSCRDLRCCGNLLVLCLFVIWQAQHYWHQVIRIHPGRKKVNKVPSQNWAVPSVNCDICFGMTPDFLFSLGQFRELDAHVQQWVQEKTEERRRSIQQAQTQYLLSWQHQCHESPQGVLTSAEPMFCSTSFPDTCMSSWDNSWEAGYEPWCLSDDQIFTSLPPTLEVCQEPGQLPAHSQEEFLPLQPFVSLRSQPTATASVSSLPKLPSTQRTQAFSRGLQPAPAKQRQGIPTMTFCSCLQGRESQTLVREGKPDSRQTQAVGWVKPRENGEEDARETKAKGRSLPIDYALEGAAETKALEWGRQGLVIHKASGNFLTPRWGRQDQVGAGTRMQTLDVGERSPSERGGENPEELRCKTDAATQTPEWGSLGKGRNEDASGENNAGARGESEEAMQAQGLGKQGQPRNGSRRETQTPGQRKQGQVQGNPGTEFQAEEWGSKGRAGGKKTLQTQLAEQERFREAENDDDAETQTLGWGRRERTGPENVSENEDASRAEKTREIQVSEEKLQKHPKYELHTGLGNQDPRREGIGRTQASRKKQLREVREKDWVMIQVLWWSDHKLVVSKVVRDSEEPCWGSQDQAVSKHGVNIQTTEEWNQRKGGDEESTNTLAPGAKYQRQVRGETHIEMYPPARGNQEQQGGENSADTEALGQQRKLKEAADEKVAQELGAENQWHVNRGMSRKIHPPEQEYREHHRGQDGANTQVSRAEDCRESTDRTKRESHSAEWEEEPQPGSENRAETQALKQRSQREFGKVEGAESWELGKESQSQLKRDIGRRAYLAECRTQDHMGEENQAKIQTPERRNQKGNIGEEGTETQSPKSENRGQFEGGTGVSHPPARRTWEQTEGKKDTENQALEKRNKRAVGCVDARESQRLGKTQADGGACSPPRQQIRAEDGAGLQGKRGSHRDSAVQAPGRDGQEQLRSGCDGDTQRQGRRNWGKAREEVGAETQNEGSQTRSRTEDAGGSRGNKEQSRANVGRDSLHAEHSGSELSPALPGFRHGATGEEQAVTSVCYTDKTLVSQLGEAIQLAGGEGHHLAKQSRAPARRHREEASMAFQKPRPNPLRRRHGSKEVGPGNGSSLTLEHQNPQSLTAPLGSPPASSSVATLLDAPTAHSVLPKQPILKKSQRMLLESLMRRKIAHLKWGPPQRILKSYLLSSFLGICPLPFAGMKSPGCNTNREAEQQEGPREDQGARPALKFSQGSWKSCPPERKSSRLFPQAITAGKCGLHGPRPVELGKCRRVKPPPGGSREPEIVQENRPPGAKLAARRNLRPSAESRYDQERARIPSSESSRSRQTVRPGGSRRTERAPSRVQISHSQKVTLPPRCTWKQPPVQRRGSLAPVEGRGAGNQPSFCPTDTSSFKGSLYSAAARLGEALLGKLSCRPHLAKSQHLAPNLNLRNPGPSLRPRRPDPPVWEDIKAVHTSLKMDSPCSDRHHTGVTPTKIQRPQDPKVLLKPNETPQNPPVSPKFGFVNHLSYFLHQHGLRK